VLGRTWPAVCDQLLGHYEAVQAESGRRRRHSHAA
jgi:phosphatidylinositol alpha 1,6-mannosyltransferase